MGVIAGQAGQADDGVAMDPDQACGGADATSFLEMAEDRHNRLVGELGPEEDGPFVLREGVLADVAAEESVLAMLAEAVVNREVSGVASAEFRTLGIGTAETREIVHRHEASWVKNRSRLAYPRMGRGAMLRQSIFPRTPPAFRLEGKRLTAVTLSEDIYSIPKDHAVCIHFNGFVDTLDRQKLWTELKLTETSYITASIADTSWAMLFRQDLKLARAVFFVGYSLYDLDIKRIINESVSMKDKSFFYLGQSPPEASRRRASRFGTIIQASAQDFVTAVRHVAGKYTPTKDPALNGIDIRPNILLLKYLRQSHGAVVLI